MNDVRALVGIVIDPGHGGTDSGAVGNNILEKNYNLLISKYMYDRFKELGVPVTLTRTEDTTLTQSERVARILNAYGNNSNVVVISNHLNSSGGTGAEVIYALRNTSTLAEKVLNNLGATGSAVRKYYQRRLPSDTSKDYYFIHRDTGQTEPIIVEYGFIDDTASNVNFLKDNYKNLAEAVIQAVMSYKGLMYVPPEGYVINTYVVVKGDSLYSIASKLGTTVSELQKLNNLTTTSLSIGQVLKIPSQFVEEEPGLYTVKKGDSLYSIAIANNTTVDILKELNNLTSNLLSVGQTLKLPEPVMEGVSTYTVQKGDSLYSISKKFNTTVSELQKLNNLSSTALSIGQVLKLPTEVVEEEKDYIEYIVKSGDSLYSIAKQFNIDYNTIKNFNNLTSNLLSIGQTLKIPTVTQTETTYVVQPGDNLYSIARRFNITVDRLKELNNLTSNLLSIGQILIVE